MDQIADEFKDVPAAQVFEVAKATPDRMVMVIKGQTIEGDDKVKTVALTLGEGNDGRKRLADAGLTLVTLGGQVQIAQAKFGSKAAKSGFEQGWEVQTLKVPTDRPNPHWFYLPALLLIGLVWWNQGRRMNPTRPNAA
jgi:hypothetical protein